MHFKEIEEKMVSFCRDMLRTGLSSFTGFLVAVFSRDLSSSRSQWKKLKEARTEWVQTVAYIIWPLPRVSPLYFEHVILFRYFLKGSPVPFTHCRETRQPLLENISLRILFICKNKAFPGHSVDAAWWSSLRFKIDDALQNFFKFSNVLLLITGMLLTTILLLAKLKVVRRSL